MSYCGFIGQNLNLFAYGYRGQEPSCLRIKALISGQISALYDIGITDFLIGCSTGTEVWAAQEVLSLMQKHSDVNLHCITTNEDLRIFYSDILNTQYEEIRSQCISRIFIDAASMEDYQEKKNMYLVNHSKQLIAFYDTYRGGKSSIIHTLEHALTKDIELIHMHPEVLPTAG